MLVLALTLNCLIVFPLTYALLTNNAGMDAAYGPDSDARRILACLYGTIGAASAYALALIAMDQRPAAVQIAIVLFVLQIVYKLATVVVVGPGHAVAQANMFVVVVLGITLITLRS
ncbi:hypothetical protein ASD8599_00618 [Ascidiaceihabitans donghaensis]|uniref:Uncharacterized protein n=1 Tax=Ascidiaceihabitans donghaensis TaxID=1510460 RepID=A0A2R8BA02_9RHOB|nr:hypothetical protein [Ascidiaceihabitans donghaensis]SPH19879.1 hypothetical protein ASD8599_00618 [Ascidiaceihabitans donghaensis]